ncbi:MAG: hypothetical protein ACXWIM_19970, partial [Burkholderiales bacterium]
MLFGMEMACPRSNSATGRGDLWSPPIETLQTHRGDCEDYAIVKYVALLQAGRFHDDMKIVVLRNLLPQENHAAVAAPAHRLVADRRHRQLA